MNKENDLIRNKDIVEINLRSMVFYILSKWKWIICLFIVGALIGGLVSYIKMEEKKPEKLEQKVQRINIHDNSFSIERIRQVADYQKMYDAKVKRDEDSYLLKMNPANIFSASISYYVFSNEKNIDIIDTILDNMLNRNDEWTKLWKASGEFCSENAFMELVKVRFDQPDYSERINVESNEEKTRGGVLSVFAAMPDSESSKSVRDYLSDLVIKTLDELSKAYPEGYAYEQISNTEYYGFSQEVLDEIKTSAETRKALLDSLNAQKSALSDDEEAYYSYYYEHETIEPVSVTFSKKTPVLGAFVAAILGVLWFALRYILDRHFKETSDSLFDDIPIIAEIEANSAPKKGIDRLIYQMKNHDRGLTNNTEYLNTILAARSFDKAILAGNINDPDIKQLIDTLCADDHRLIASGALSSDVKSVENLEHADSIILVMHTMKDFRTTVRKDIEIALSSGKTIEGAIVLQ